MTNTRAAFALAEIQNHAATHRKLHAQGIGHFRAAFTSTIELVRANVKCARRARRRRHTIRALSSLSDHTLKDIGLRRDEISWVAEATSISPEPLRPVSVRLIANVATRRDAGNSPVTENGSSVAN